MRPDERDPAVSGTDTREALIDALFAEMDRMAAATRGQARDPRTTGVLVTLGDLREWLARRLASSSSQDRERLRERERELADDHGSWLAGRMLSPQMVRRISDLADFAGNPAVGNLREWLRTGDECYLANAKPDDLREAIRILTDGHGVEAGSDRAAVAKIPAASSSPSGGEPPRGIDTFRAHARHEHDETPDPACRVCAKFNVSGGEGDDELTHCSGCGRRLRSGGRSWWSGHAAGCGRLGAEPDRPVSSVGEGRAPRETIALKLEEAANMVARGDDLDGLPEALRDLAGHARELLPAVPDGGQTADARTVAEAAVDALDGTGEAPRLLERMLKRETVKVVSPETGQDFEVQAAYAEADIDQPDRNVTIVHLVPSAPAAPVEGDGPRYNDLDVSGLLSAADNVLEWIAHNPPDMDGEQQESLWGLLDRWEAMTDMQHDSHAELIDGRYEETTR